MSDEKQVLEAELKDGNGKIKFGLGVGAVSATSLLVLGVTCPLCTVVAPAMVAIGLHKRHKAKKAMAETKPEIKLRWPEHLA